MSESEGTKQLQHILRVGACQGFYVGVLLQEAFVDGRNEIGSRALKQEFRDEDVKGVVALPPGENAGVHAGPLNNPAADPRRIGRSNVQIAVLTRATHTVLTPGRRT
jgi:hypothetical protein